MLYEPSFVIKATLSTKPNILDKFFYPMFYCGSLKELMEWLFNPFVPNTLVSTSWKHQKTLRFCDVFGRYIGNEWVNKSTSNTCGRSKATEKKKTTTGYWRMLQYEFNWNASNCFCQIYYEAFVFVTNAFQKRFEQLHHQRNVALENLLIKAVNNEDFSKVHKLVKEFYHTNFEPKPLKYHSPIFTGTLRNYVRKTCSPIQTHCKTLLKTKKS